MGPLRKLMPAVVLVVALLAVVPAASAAVRLEGAGDVPFYARILFNEEWAAVFFYRPPQCVPTDFDLYTAFFDIPRAFECGPPTTDGFAIWRNGPDRDFAPKQLNLRGLGAVPFYFVTTAELKVAVADDVLTIGEVEALPSLLAGVATSYHEILHPSEGARNGHITVVAHGTLADGRTFRFQASDSARNSQVQIAFR